MPKLNLKTILRQRARGPIPTCVCGDCITCKNRERQRRWQNQQKERQLTDELIAKGYDLDLEPERDE